MVNTDELNNIIKEKENIIINLKSNNIHLENKIKELEKDNNSLKDKIDSITNPIVEEENEGEKEMSFDGVEINLENSLDHDKIANLIADEDAEEEAFDTEGDILAKNTNTDYLNNDDLSISMSLFNKPLGFDDFDNNEIVLKKKSLNIISEIFLLKQYLNRSMEGKDLLHENHIN